MAKNECCFYWTYKRGAIIIACTGIIFISYFLYNITQLTFTENEKQKDYPKEDYPFSLFMHILAIVADLLLIWAAVKVQLFF